MVNVWTTSAAKGSAYQVPSLNGSPIELLSEDGASIAGTSTPLSDVRFVDGGTTVVASSQTGAIATPYGLLATGLADASASVVQVTPGAYNAEGTLTIARTMALVGIGIDNSLGFSTADLNIGNTLIVSIENAALGNVSSGTGGNTRLLSCSASSAKTSGAASQLVLDHSTIVGVVQTGQLVGIATQFVGAITIAGTLSSFSDCKFAGGINITFSGAAGTVTFDLESYRRFLAAAGTVTNGTIVSGDFLVPAANVAALATAHYAHIPNGESVYVISRNRAYMSVPVGTGEVVGTGNDWQGMPETSNHFNLLQGNWWIDGVAGSDDNTGADLAHPLKTSQELVARLGGPDFDLVQAGVPVSYVITYVNDTINGDALLLRPNFNVQSYAAAPTFPTFGIVGIPTGTILVGGNATNTVATSTAQSVNNPPKLTLTGIADLTIAGPGATSIISDHLVGGKIANIRGRVVGGARDGLCFYFAKAAPDGGDTNATGRIHPCVTPGAVSTPAIPQVNDVITFEKLPVLTEVQVDAYGNFFPTGSASVPTWQLTMQNVYCTQPHFCCHGAATDEVVYGCIIRGGYSVAPELAGREGPQFNGCWIDTFFLSGGLPGYSLITSLEIIPPLSNQVVIVHGFLTVEGVLLQGTGFQIESGASVNTKNVDFAVCDSGFAGVEVRPSGVLNILAAGVYGYNNSNTGIQIDGTGTVNYASASTRTITGTTGDIRIKGISAGGATVTQVIPWTALPWNDGMRSFSVALAGGTVNQATPWTLATQEISVTCKTPAGVAPSQVYSVPTASRTTTNITVNSTAGGETSTIAINVAAAGTGARILRLQ